MRSAPFLLVVFLALGASPTASAQSVDGFAANQLVPVVVDSTSFAQRFHLQNRNTASVEITPWYYPGNNTAQATAISCPAFTLAAGSEKVFASVRAICPALGAGSHFGMLLFRHEGFNTFSVFTRVSNPQGAGFAVEGFPLSTFSAGRSVVTGVRRLAAAGNAPAYQTNCFVGAPETFAVPAGAGTQVKVSAYSSAGAKLGEVEVLASPGKLMRLLDVFAAVGAPAGDYGDARVEFDAVPGGQYIAFCTVQDNTSFGADFRIAKTAVELHNVVGANIGAYDWFVARDTSWEEDIMGRQFVIPPGQYVNSHLFVFHGADFGQCELVDENLQRLTPAYGLEMRVTNPSEFPYWGGNNSVVVPDPQYDQDAPYFGDKTQWSGNGMLVLQVESNGQNEAAPRPYRLRCRSGSGMSPPTLIEYQRAGSDF